MSKIMKHSSLGFALFAASLAFLGTLVTQSNEAHARHFNCNLFGNRLAAINPNLESLGGGRWDLVNIDFIFENSRSKNNINVYARRDGRWATVWRSPDSLRGGFWQRIFVRKSFEADNDQIRIEVIYDQPAGADPRCNFDVSASFADG